MHGGVFSELSQVIIVTVAVSLVMRLLRQPLILGYILAGLLVGPSFLNLIHHVEMFETFSSIGIALLLFIIGMGMNVSELKRLGKPVLIAALSSFASVGSLGFLAASMMGFAVLESIIVSFALFFSSTIIIVKLLSDRKETNRLNGQIAIGVILVEDIVATMALLFIVAGDSERGFNPESIALLLLKGVVLISLLVIANTRILLRISKFMASSQELLFLFAIGWGFGIATLFDMAGFSIEVGALFAGVSLASLPYAQEISARLKPLRDFFVVLFFITMGQSLSTNNLQSALLPALLLSTIVIVIKPMIITLTLGLLGYTRRVSFLTGINLSQISEFSIVLIVLANTSGLASPELSAIITLVAIITIAISTYLMNYDRELFRVFERVPLHMFEREAKYKEHKKRSGYQMVLFGYHRGGHEFIRAFRQLGKRYVVVDYDPAVIDVLEHRDVPFVYGDGTDLELLEEIEVENAKLIVSTFSDFHVTRQLVESIRRVNKKAVIVCHANNQEEAIDLYELGASYVMIPHYIGSEKVSLFIRKNGLRRTEFEHYREKHMAYLRLHYKASPEL
ncbi:hypothetical protein CR970_02740 [Candidatus Saccharibacteria bacterium]|nr:MAG: hypothetical protein CR970_02740 [Candidatus Saccharibacteria bacterium]